MKILVFLAILLLASSCNAACLETILVFAGDTCESINANNPNDISMDEFMALNPGIDCNSLEPGSNVCIAGDLPQSDGNNNSDQEPSNSLNESDQGQEPSSDGGNQNSSDQEQSEPAQSDQEPTSNGTGQNSSDQEQTNPPEETEEQENSSDNQEIPSDAVVVVSEPEQTPIEAEPTPTTEQESSPSETAGNSSDEEQSPSEEESTPIPSDADEYEPFIQEVLAVHQYYRDFFGSPPLVWNYTLNASAYSWVQYCMSTNNFAHSDDLGAGTKYGEIISVLAGYYEDSTGHHSVSFNATQLIRSLVDPEWRNFINGSVIFDDSDSITGSWYGIGHFTQVIWKNSTSVGCGMTNSGDTTAIVCQYYPPGNAIGDKIY